MIYSSLDGRAFCLILFDANSYPFGMKKRRTTRRALGFIPLTRSCFSGPRHRLWDPEEMRRRGRYAVTMAGGAGMVRDVDPMRILRQAPAKTVDLSRIGNDGPVHHLRLKSPATFFLPDC
ncbi:hypothetical protein LZ31DRAFT_122817 [Colletotrichum somersetense]|nr:hypothetical protein LZ31DRAFT_122817 [Colletotrichum somersetense]